MPPCPARPVGCRAAGACLALGILLAGSAPAGAVDWQVLYRLTETLRVSDNIELRPDPDGAAFSSNTGAGLDITARSPTAEWGLTGDVGQLMFFGEGAPEDRKRTTAAIRSDLLKRTRSTDFNLNAHFSIAPATGLILSDQLLVDPVSVDAELADLGRELVNFERISFGAGGGFTHHMTRVDDLLVRGRGSRVEFTDDAPSATPHTYVELSGEWIRRLTRLVDGRARASVAFFESEDDADTRRLIYNLAFGANVRPVRRLTLDLNAGVAVIDQEFDEDPGLAGAGGRESDLSVGFIGDLSLAYKPRRDTTMTLELSQRVSPNSLGDLRTTQAASAAVAYRINERSSIDLAGTFTNSRDTGEASGSSQAWTVSPRYTHALTRHWDLSLGYRYLESDVARSNSAFLTLSHRGTILP